MVKAKAEAKATVAIKVIRADGSEESYFSEDVTVTDANVVAKLIDEMPGVTSGVTPEEAERRNAEESKRNAEANQRAAAAAQQEG